MPGKQLTGIHIIAGLAILLTVATVKQTRSMPHLENKMILTAPGDTTLKNNAGKFLEDLMKEYPQYFEQVLKHWREWNVQILYTRVDRDSKGNPELQTFPFHVDPARYFYPASTVKLPVVLLALQRLNELKDNGIDKNTTMITERETAGQSAVYNDPTTPDGRPTIAHYIKKILMVSDNDAFNRLYEFLGQGYINAELHKRGYSDVQILHRLSIALSEDENRQTNPIQFMGPDHKVLYTQRGQWNKQQYAPRNDLLGLGYYSGEKLVNSPMDFSRKNRISLPDLHEILLSLVFPNKVPANKRFNITEDDRLFVLRYMSQLPTESMYPPYKADTLNYWPAYGKFLLYGAQKGPIPGNIRIFSKEGDAYGQMVDVAYVADLTNKIEFFLSAAIYCNSDGILNDDKYDYETIGLPFLKHLGRVIYNMELKRERKIRPDLSPFVFEYDK